MRSIVLASFVLLLAACESNAKDDDPKAKAAESAPLGWPRELKKDEHTLVLYQPQIERWENYRRLHANLAFVVSKKGSGETHYGVLSVSAATEADMEDRKVLIKKPRIDKISFPAATGAQIAELKQLIEARR